MSATRWRSLALGLVCVASPASAQLVEYYHTDLVGNVRAVTDEKGTVIERHDYLPFGEECTTGLCASNPGVGAGQPRKFTGKERDAETGLDYFGARYYRPSVGRFTTTDPAYTIPENILDPQRWNKYAYARNNPLRYTDPDGRDFRDFMTGAANAFGSNFWFGKGRTAGGNEDFQFGQFVGDLASIPAGYAWGDAGATIGGLGLAGAPESAGLTLIATGAGVGMMVQGGTASLAGLANAGMYLAKNSGDTGSYTVTFESNKRYHGKGPESRANDSAKRVGTEHDDPAKKVRWKPAANDKEAFKAEARRIRADGGIENPENYNKINSPGER